MLQSIGIRRGMVVNGRVSDGAMDELSTLGENTIAEFYQDRGFTVSRDEPELFPLQPATLDDLKGGDAEANAATIRAILAGGIAARAGTPCCSTQPTRCSSR